MLCESLCLSAATAELEWVSALMESLRFSSYCPRANQRRQDVTQGLRRQPVVMANDDPQFRDPDAVIIVDAKALFDAIAYEQTAGDDRRSALEVAVIKESVSLVGGRMRWIPHNHNPADALTKHAGAHAQPLVQLLRTGSLMLRPMEEVLAEGKQGEHRAKISSRTASRLLSQRPGT